MSFPNLEITKDENSPPISEKQAELDVSDDEATWEGLRHDALKTFDSIAPTTRNLRSRSISRRLALFDEPGNLLEQRQTQAIARSFEVARESPRIPGQTRRDSISSVGSNSTGSNSLPRHDLKQESPSSPSVDLEDGSASTSPPDSKMSPYATSPPRPIPNRARPSLVRTVNSPTIYPASPSSPTSISPRGRHRGTNPSPIVTARSSSTGSLRQPVSQTTTDGLVADLTSQAEKATLEESPTKTSPLFPKTSLPRSSTGSSYPGSPNSPRFPAQSSVLAQGSPLAQFVVSGTDFETRQLALPSQSTTTPTRFVPQNQALVTTDVEGRILTVNEVVLRTFGYQRDEIMGGDAWQFLASPYREKHRRILQEPHNDSVLVCGKVIRIVKKDTKTAAASLWLKQKRTDSGTVIYMWVFEELKENNVTLSLNHQGRIVQASGACVELFGWAEDEMSSKHLWDLIPSLKTSEVFDVALIDRLKFFGAVTRQGLAVPVICKIIDSQGEVVTIQMISMPNIAGVITVSENGLILSCNTVFAKYLFGISAKDLVGKVNITRLIPQIWTVVHQMELMSGTTPLETPANIGMVSPMESSALSPQHLDYRMFPNTPATPIIPIPRNNIIAYHRDGTPFNIDLQVRPNVEHDELVYTLWITYDRYSASKANIFAQHAEAAEKQMGSPSSPPSSEITTSSTSVVRSIKDFEILETLGEGAYGFVKLAELNSEKVVIKYVIKSRILVDTWIRDRVLGTVPMEIHVLDYLRKHPHPCIVRMIDYWQDDEYYYIQQAIHGYGMDLFDYIEYNQTMNEAEIKHIFHQVALAVNHLHSRNIVHRDIKDENIILDEHNNIQLIDFGSSAYVKEGKKFDTFCGTLDYASPEVLTGHKYDGPPQDIWAMGILLYTMIYKENPFYNIDEIISRPLRIPWIMSPESLDLIQFLLDRDVKRRPTIEQVLKHPWFSPKVSPKMGNMSPAHPLEGDPEKDRVQSVFL